MIGKLNSFLGDKLESSQLWTWTLFRVLVSAMFMTHGLDKLFGENPQPFIGGGMTSINIGDLISFPMPLEINALFVAGSIELVGGFLLLIGLWTHMIALIAVLDTLMAFLIAHLAWFPTLNGGELATMYFLCYLILFTFGGGHYSADTFFDMRRQEKRRKKMEAANK